MKKYTLFITGSQRFLNFILFFSLIQFNIQVSLSQQGTLTISCEKDSYVNPLLPDSNFNDQGLIEVGVDWGVFTEGEEKKGFLEFDISALPYEANIIKAKLILYCEEQTDNELSIKVVKSTWYPNYIDFDVHPSSISNDSTGITISDSGFTEADITNVVEGWVKREYLNAGLVLEVVDPAPDTYFKFRSSNYPGNPGYEPKLEVIYTLPEGVNTWTFYPSKDATICNQFSPKDVSDKTFSAYTSFLCLAWTGGGIPFVMRSFIEFNLDLIPKCDTVIDATFYLYNGFIDHNPLDESNASSLLRILEPWHEDTLTYNNAYDINAIDKNHPHAIPLDSTVNPDENKIVDVTDLVKGWRNDSFPNYGLMLKLDDEVYWTRMDFISSDMDTLDQHPRLVIKTKSGLFTEITTGDIVNNGGNSYGAAWGDYDNDGYIDLFVTNDNVAQKNFLYHNEGNSTFTSITTGDIVDELGESAGCSWGDYDNDGFLDLYVTDKNAANFLFHNEGDGSFTKVTTGIIVTDVEPSRGCNWGDYDNDGYLDMFVANLYANNSLYHNDGDGTFTKITTGDIVTDGGSSQACLWFDYNNDGWLDLFVSNKHGGTNCLYTNNTDGTFTKDTDSPVANDDAFTQGGSFGDYDKDGYLDLFVTSDNNDTNFFYQNSSGSFIQNITSIIASEKLNSYPSAWVDVNNDSDLDLFVGNANNLYNTLYFNNNDGSFSKDTSSAVVSDAESTLGSVWGDYDNDGDMDLFVANYIGEDNQLFRNNTNVIGTNWIKIRCTGDPSNNTAIGARITVVADILGTNERLIHEISGQTGNFSQNSMDVHFGLGDASRVDTVIIEWPSGNVTQIANVMPNQLLVIKESNRFVRKQNMIIVSDTLESMACVWGDFNNDNYQDLFVANRGGDNNLLYKNNGDGTFTKITSGDIVNDEGESYSASWGDYDNDGYLDLYVTNMGQANFLYHNNGNETFTRILAGDMVTNIEQSLACSWTDYDNDGFLDIFVSNRSSTNNSLYRNNGGLSFTKITTGDIVNDGGDSYGIAWGDYNNDGFEDLYVANSYGVEKDNSFYENLGNGSFISRPSLNIVDYEQVSSGANWVDANNDGYFDLFVANGGNTNEVNNFFVNNGNRTFTEITTGDLFLENRWTNSSVWGDFNNDGYIDLVTSNYQANQGNYLYENSPGMIFNQVTDEPFVFINGTTTKSASYCDVDNDGDLDLFFVSDLDYRANAFFENMGEGKNYLQIKCVGVVSNYAAIGALVKVLANGYWQNQRITANMGEQSQSSMLLHFGLNDATLVDSIVVQWPSGIISKLRDIPVNQMKTIHELYSVSGAVTFINDTLPGCKAQVYESGTTQPGNFIRECTNVDGTYIFDSLPSGAYRILALPEGAYTDSCYNTYYGDTTVWDGASIITVIDTSISGLDISMVPKVFSISGRATIEGNNMLEGTVRLFDGNLVNQGSPLKEVQIHSGYYTFDSIYLGNYKILAIPGGAYPDSCFNTYYGDTTVWEGAGIITVTDTNMSGMDISMVPKLFSISGGVTFKGNDIDEVTVQLYNGTLAFMGSILEQVDVQDGYYEFDSIYYGSYKVLAIPGSTYIDSCYSTFYGDTTIWQEADTIIITDSNITNANINLIPIPTVGFLVSGNVYTCTGSLSTGTAELIDTSDLSYESVSVSDGNYQFMEVMEGGYVLRIIPGGDDEVTYLPTYYGDDPNITRAIILSIDKDTSEVNVNLAPSTFNTSCFLIRGMVYAGSENLEEGQVELYETTGDFVNPDYLTEVANGSYRFNRIIPGNYKIKAVPAGTSSSLYYSTWYTRVLDHTEAYEFTISASLNVGIHLLPRSVPVQNMALKNVSIYIYPNPFSTTISVIFNIPDDADIFMNLYNITGQKLQTTKYDFEAGENIVALTLEQFDEGLYFVEFIINHQKTGVFKIIKQDY